MCGASVRYDLAPLGVRNPEVIWRASNTGTDTHHINSIIEWQGSLVISAFGPKFGTLWASAMDGYIHDISQDRRIKGGIYHPHSLSVLGDRLYFLESYRKLFWCLEGPMTSLDDGYSRGVCWLSNDFVCLASSIGRRLSRSTGLIANPADPGKVAGNCGVIVRNVTHSKTIKRINLEGFGPEIYDLMITDAAGVDGGMLQEIHPHCE